MIDEPSKLVRLRCWVGSAPLVLSPLLLLGMLFGVLIVIAYFRTFIPSFEPLMNAFSANHPTMGGYFRLLADIGPDMTSVMLSVLGLTYLAPRTIELFTKNKPFRLGLVVLIAFFCLFTIIDNQLNREEQERWQADLKMKMTNVSADVKALKPNFADKFLYFFKAPNRITDNIAPSPKPADHSQIPPVTSKPESPAPTALSADEITMIRETATAAATGIQQDFDKIQSKIDERYQQIPGNMNSPSVYSQKARESAASGPLAYQPHEEAVQSIINVANAHLADPHWELIIPILQLRSSCIIGVAPGAIQGCVSQLRAVASQAKP